MQRRFCKDSSCIATQEPEPQDHPMESLCMKSFDSRYDENHDLGGKDNTIGLTENTKGFLSSKLSQIQEKESMHVVIRPLLLLGQCFGLVPVCGILKHSPNDLRFSWMSKRVIYAMTLLLATVMMAAIEISNIAIIQGFTAKSIVDMISLVLSIGEIIFSIQQGQNWPKLIAEWSSVERRMKHLHPTNGLNSKVKVLVYTYFFGAAILVFAQLATYMNMLHRCSPDPLVKIKLAIVAMYYPIFAICGVSALTITILVCLTVHHYVLVIYDELTITVLSLCLAVKFRQLNRYLIRYRKQKLSLTFWAEIREIFNSLSSLSKQLDSHLSRMTFLCFGSNLYYSCTLLLDMLSGHKKNTWASVFILLFTLTRTFLAALAASYINEDSKKPLASLFSVRSDSYNVEVCRFQTQVTHDDIAITGCNFFSITRSFILTIAGTIMTYEIVLLQFGNISLASRGPTNNTKLCFKVINILN